ncbi:hypothetical protein AHF37_09590, partial [Paragonimus kellicotti]
GIDFYFGTRSQAVAFVNFLCKRAPCRLDLRNCNVNNLEFDKLSEHQVPDVVLVLRPPQSAEGDLHSVNGSSTCARSSKLKRKRKHSATALDVSTSMATETESQMDFSDAEDEEWEDVADEDEDVLTE